MLLDNLQVSFFKAIYRSDSKSLESAIKSSSVFTAKNRINIYKNNTIGTLIETLQNHFPICKALVGENYFKQLASFHINNNPSMNRNLDEYGKQFPQTLENLISIRDELTKLPYLADISQLEWLVHKSYYAANKNIFNMDKYSLLSEQRQTLVSFCLAEDVTILSSLYPIYDIWTHHQQQSEKEISALRSQSVLVQRKRFNVNVTLIDNSLYQLLMSIEQGSNLQQLTKNRDNVAADIVNLIQQEIITGFN